MESEFTEKGFFIFMDDVTFVKYKDISKISSSMYYEGRYLYIEDRNKKVLCKLDTTGNGEIYDEILKHWRNYHKKHEKDNYLKQMVEKFDKFLEMVEFAPGGPQYTNAENSFNEAVISIKN